jgi:hypothetical protein
VAGSCEHGNETSDSVGGMELLDELSYCQLLKRDSFMIYGVDWIQRRMHGVQ